MKQSYECTETTRPIVLNDSTAATLYYYYSYGGFGPALGIRIASALNLLCVSWWSFVLLCLVNWSSLSTNVFVFDPLDVGTIIGMIFLGFSLVIAIGMMASAGFRSLSKVRELLGPNVEVSDLTWVEFCSILENRLIRHPEVHRHNVSTLRDVTTRVCRVSDLFLACQDFGMLDLIYGWVPRSRFGHYLIRAILLHPRFQNRDNGLATWVQASASNIQKATFLTLIQCIFLVPLVTCFNAIKMIGASGAEYHARHVGSSSRLVTLRGRDVMAEYMELPHEINYRAARLAQLTESASRTQGSRWPAIASQMFMMPLMVFLLIGFVHEDALGKTVFLSKNLLWWMAGLALCVSFLRSAGGNWSGYWTPTQNRKGASSDPCFPTQKLADVSRCFEHPERLTSKTLFAKASKLAPSQLMSKVKDLVGTLLVPVMLIRLFKQADRLSLKLNSFSAYEPGIGSVCVCSLLDPQSTQTQIQCKSSKIIRSRKSFAEKASNSRKNDLTASMVFET